MLLLRSRLLTPNAAKRWTRTLSTAGTAASVPIVDMSLPPKDLGRAVHQACTTVGFFHLIHHGVSKDLQRTILRETRDMFSLLTHDQKEAFSVAHSNSYRGYQRVGVNITGDQPDGHEGLDLVSESPRAIRRQQQQQQDHLHGLTNYGLNQWPDPALMPNLRRTVEQYIQELNGVGNRLMAAASLGLGLGPEFFQPYFTDAYWSMRLLRYPGVAFEDTHDDNYYEYGVGEHTDYGVFTMILCDDVKNALQIRPKGSNSSDWMTVDPIEGGFICNIGDMLARWTNNIYVSTPHRVLRPHRDRISVPFFFDPNYDSWIEPIRELVQASGRPACFQPILYGDHLLAKTSKNFRI